MPTRPATSNTSVLSPEPLTAAVDNVVAAWSEFFASVADWRQLVEGVDAKDGGCGLVYELASPTERPGLDDGESVAIADMSSLQVAEPHYHSGETEIYFVIQGTATVVVGNRRYEVGPGDVVVTPPGVAHYTAPHYRLVLGVVNAPAFQAFNYIPVQETNTSVQFDADLFNKIATSSVDGDLSQMLKDLSADLEAWATVLLVPNQRRSLLACRAACNLPEDWGISGNFLDSGSMNATVFINQQELVANGIDEDRPPTNRPVSRHRMTAAAAVPVPGIGTLEAIADSDGYMFDDARVQCLRDAASEVAKRLDAEIL